MQCLSPDQVAIVDRVCADPSQNFFITGPAGTGKTVLLTAISTRLEQSSPGTVVKIVTATGVAASNCKGQTIHSAFGINASDKKSSVESLAARARCTHVDVLIIDEISSVSNKLFFVMHKLLQNVRDERDKPFGGAKIIMFGDFKQIGPVTIDAVDFFFEQKVNKDGLYCFETELWHEMCLETIRLTHIFRQEQDDKFLNLLEHVRATRLSLADCHQLVRRVLVGPVAAASWGEEYPTHLFGKNADADNINNTKFKTLSPPDFVFKARYSWLDAKSNRVTPTRNMTLVERSLSSTVPASVCLRLGARVMVRSNNSTFNVYNGMCGTIVDADDFSVTLKLANGKERKVGRHKFSWTYTDEATKKTATLVVEQLSVCLAWAMTIHKSQGLTLDLMVLDMSPQSIFEPYQAYVGLSRARKLSDIFLVNFNPTVCRSRDTVSNFYNDTASTTPAPKTSLQAYDFDSLCGDELHASGKHPNLVSSFVKHMDPGTRSAIVELRQTDKRTFFVYGDNIIIGVVDTAFIATRHPTPDQFIEIGGDNTTTELDSIFKEHELKTVHSVYVEFIATGDSEDLIVYMDFYAGNRFVLKLPKKRVLLLTGLAAKYIAKLSTDKDAKAFVRILKSH